MSTVTEKTALLPQEENAPKKVLAGSLSIVGTILSAALVIAGNSVTIITINFWLLSFPKGASPQLAVLGVANTFFFATFAFVLLACTFRFGAHTLRYAICGDERAQQDEADALALRLAIIESGGDLNNFNLRDPSVAVTVSQLSFWSRFRVFRTRHATVIRRVRMLAVVGLLDILESLMLLYATPPTPEVLQALLECTIPFFTLGMSVIFIPEERAKQFKSPLLLSASVLLIVGIVTASWSTFATASEIGGGGSQIAWIMIYIGSCVAYGGWSVNQRLYLDEAHAQDEAEEDDRQTASRLGSPIEALPSTVTDKSPLSFGVVPVSIRRALSGDAINNNNNGSRNNSPPRSMLDEGVDFSHFVSIKGAGSPLSATVKAPLSFSGRSTGSVTSRHATFSSHLRRIRLHRLSSAKLPPSNTPVPSVLHKVILLVGDTGFQLLWTFFFLPFDALPWFGSSTDVQATWGNFTSGYRYTFENMNAFTLAALYIAGYVSTYAGEAILTHFSPTFSCIVLQVSSPVTAVILLLRPSWNANEGVGSWQMQVAGLVLIFVAAVLYAAWEKKQEAAFIEELNRADEPEREEGATS